jgi:hypothetical protein
MHPTEEAKAAVLLKVRQIVGYNISGLGDILSILSGPEVLPLVRTYLDLQENEK